MKNSIKEESYEIKGIGDIDALLSDLEKIEGDKNVSDETFHVYSVMLNRREITISISNGANLDYYSQKDGSWRIFSNYREGSHYMVGTIHSYNKVTYKDSEMADFPKSYRNLIKEFNKVFQEHMKPNSIKFITSKVIEKLAKIRKIDTKDIFIGRSAIYDTMTDIEEGRPSKSRGPLKVYHLSEGEHKGRYLLSDGYHRLFILLLNHKTKVDVDIIGYGDGVNKDIPIPYKTFSIDPSLKFMGLEDLADEDILEDLKEKQNK